MDRPEGLIYEAEFVTAGEEAGLLSFLETLDLHTVTMRGQTARRTVRHFGYDYDYETWQLRASDPIPPLLLPLRDRCAALAGLEPADFVQCLVSRYPPGATIGWHRDAPMFGSRVAGVSLGAPCRMRFQRGKGEARRVFALELEPRSAYVLSGAARSAWQHSIPPTKSLRWSVTFRTCPDPARWSQPRRQPDEVKP